MNHLKIICFNIGFINLIFELKYQYFSIKTKTSYPQRLYCLSVKLPNKTYYAYFKIKYKAIENLVT